MIVSAVLLSALQGCGAGGGSAPASQVAARVNGGEITIYRVNSALDAMQNVDAQTLAQTRRNVLDSLIDQELAAQAAEESKLDRTPAVVQAVEAARRGVLARAWLDQLSTTLPKPDANQVSNYYADHPELFSQRRIYNLQQITLPAGEPALLAEARQKIDGHVPLQQLGHWLDEKKVRYSAASGVLAAEQIPLDILAALSKAGDGQTVLIEQPKAALIVQVISSSPQPMDEATAAPRIRKFLANQAWTETIATEMKRLKHNASITYLGEFASPVPAAQPLVNGMSGTTTASLTLDAQDPQGAHP